MNVKQDTLEHIALVADLIWKITDELLDRADAHDETKLESPEKEMFEIWRPQLNEMDVNSPEYEDALKQMGPALRHHYAKNSHHPEHNSNGIAGMTLVDVCEMVCDWIAAARRSGKSVSPEWARDRFGIEPQLLSIIENTLKEFDKTKEPND